MTSMSGYTSSSGVRGGLHSNSGLGSATVIASAIVIQYVYTTPASVAAATTNGFSVATIGTGDPAAAASNSSSGGLSTGAKAAIGVVIPIGVLGVVALAIILLR
jgi:hypothetical protein